VARKVSYLHDGMMTKMKMRINLYTENFIVGDILQVLFSTLAPLV